MYKNIYFSRDKNLIHLWDSERGYLTMPYKRYAYEKSLNGEYTSMYGDRLTKIYKFEKDDPNLFESDVPETTRVLVDMYLDSDEVATNINVFTFDIECEMDSGLPDVTEATNELTAIGFHDTNSNNYVVLVMDKAGKMKEMQTDKALVIPFVKETDMCLKFLEMYEAINPDIITGWNVDSFDIPFLYNRIKRILSQTHANRLSPIGEAFYSPYRHRWFLAGVSVMDYLHLYRIYNYGELPNYRLDTVATLELGRGKLEYEGNLDELFNTDIEKFIEYNMVDVELVVNLDKKLQFVDLARSICHAGHVPYEDFIYSSKYLEGAMLTYLKRKGLVSPNKPADRREKMKAIHESGAQKFIGAYVKDPIVGKYEWVYDLDLTSLYPSIIMTLNISPETQVGKISDWDAIEYINDKTKKYKIGDDTITAENLGKYIKDENLTVASNGVLYRTDIVGCIPGILSLWFEKRVEYRKLEKKYGKAGDTEKHLFYAKRQLVQKILLNSLYGVLGLPSWRYYNLDNATAVTTSGQVIIKNTASAVNLKYNKELGDSFELVLADATKKTIYGNSKVTVKRDNVEQQILAKEIRAGDDLII